MSELPQGWSTFSIKDIGGLSGGKTPSKANPSFWNKLDIPWVSPKDMKRLCITDSEDRISEESLGEASMTLYPQDSVLMVTRSGILQHTFPVAITALPVTVNQDIKVIRPLPGISSRYMLYVLMAYGQTVLEKCSKAGTTVQSIDTEKLETMELPLAPIVEQVRITKSLDSLLAQVDTLKARLDALPPMIKRFRQAVLNAATTGQLTSNFRTENLGNNDGGGGTDTVRSIQKAKLSWAGSHREHNESKRVAKRAENWTTNGSSSAAFPVNWTLEKLEDVVLMVVDCHNKTAPYVEHGIPLVRTSNIRNGSIVWTGMKYVNEATYKFWSKRCPPKSGDLIFTREAPMGEVALIPSGETFCLGQRTMLIRPVEEGVSGRFLHYSIMSPGFQTRLEKSAVGGGVQHLRVGDVSELEVVIPPKAEQTEIVRRIDQFFAYANQLDVHLADARQRVDALTQSILAKAFRGELVPQDPNDEPASVLLERIAAQRAADPKPKRGRKTAAH